MNQYDRSDKNRYQQSLIGDIDSDLSEFEMLVSSLLMLICMYLAVKLQQQLHESSKKQAREIFQHLLANRDDNDNCSVESSSHRSIDSSLSFNSSFN